MAIVCDEHKWGLRIGTDDSKAWPFAGLKFYGLEARPLGEARQYEKKVNRNDCEEPQSERGGNADRGPFADASELPQFGYRLFAAVLPSLVV